MVYECPMNRTFCCGKHWRLPQGSGSVHGLFSPRLGLSHRMPRRNNLLAPSNAVIYQSKLAVNTFMLEHNYFKNESDLQCFDSNMFEFFPGFLRARIFESFQERNQSKWCCQFGPISTSARKGKQVSWCFKNNSDKWWYFMPQNSITSKTLATWFILKIIVL